MNPKIVMPAWHTDARRMRAAGMNPRQVVDALAEAGISVSQSRVSQVTGPSWEKHLSKEATKALATERELTAAKKEGRLPDLKHAVLDALAADERRSVDMPDRTFEEVPTEPGMTNQRVRIRCGHTGCTNSMIFSKHGDINYTQAARWFRDKGWMVGGGFRADRCPDHAFKKKTNGHAEETLTAPTTTATPPTEPPPTLPPTPPLSPTPTFVSPLSSPSVSFKGVPLSPPTTASTTTAPPMPQPPPASKPTPTIISPPSPTTSSSTSPAPTILTSSPTATPSSAATTTPSRLEKRVIHAKLEEAYADESIGYLAGWSDQRVADDLGVAVEWVALVREDSFGPDRHQEEVAITLQQATELGTKLEPAIQDVLHKMNVVQQQIKIVDDRWDTLDARLDEYDKASAALRMLITQFETKLKELQECQNQSKH